MKQILNKYTLILFLLIAVISLNADYYDGVINLTGQSLYNGLHALIDNNTNTSYTGAKTVLFQTLDNNSGNVTCVYTGRSYSVNSSYNGGSDPNTEHTYAQSWFSGSESSTKKADLHHLFVTTMTVNSSRGNLPLTTVANHSSANIYYTSTPRQSYRGSNSSGIQVFEPADQFKGNIARALLYFNTRYTNQSLTQQNVNMLPILLQWHVSDPPDAAEITRNTGVYNYQHNRNPYVDHPEFVASIWGGGTSAEDDILLSIPALQISSAYPNPFRDGLSISVQAKSPAPATTTVFNLKGQKIYTTTNTMIEGENKLQWSGLDANGRQTPAGVYFIRVESDKEQAITKVVKR
ncbi:MAG: endonuclease [Candidatus Cloacimonetes bacterium]|nr:endonuclease [Candidatus Cloacimonadota bacterium]